MSDRMAALWRRLHDRVTTMKHEASHVYNDMCAIGALYPYQTFPEAHALELAGDLDRLAASLREMADRAAALRREREASKEKAA